MLSPFQGKPPRFWKGSGAEASGGAGVSSGVAVSSATEMPNSRLRARRFSMSGEAMSVSHLLTAWRLTPSLAPSSSWEMPSPFRYSLIRWPKVMAGSSS